jgi:hypothetical protein
MGARDQTGFKKRRRDQTPHTQTVSEIPFELVRAAGSAIVEMNSDHKGREPSTLRQLSLKCKALEDEISRDAGVEPGSSEALAERFSQLEGTLEEIASACGSDTTSVSSLPRYVLDGSESQDDAIDEADDHSDDEAVVSRYFKSTKIFGTSLKKR